jgi:hypothetical protein
MVVNKPGYPAYHSTNSSPSKVWGAGRERRLAGNCVDRAPENQHVLATLSKWKQQVGPLNLFASLFMNTPRQNSSQFMSIQYQSPSNSSLINHPLFRTSTVVDHHHPTTFCTASKFNLEWYGLLMFFITRTRLNQSGPSSHILRHKRNSMGVWNSPFRVLRRPPTGRTIECR